MIIPTLQDMPDDVLGMICSNLYINEVIKLNAVLRKHIKTAKVTNVYSKNSLYKIPKYFHKYIYLHGQDISDRNIDEISKFKLFGIHLNEPVSNIENMNGIKMLTFGVETNFSIDISKLTSLTHLYSLKNNIIGYDKLVNLSLLDCFGCKHSINVDRLINLIELDCSNSNIVNVNSLVNLTSLKCDFTRIKNISNLIKLVYLSCSFSKINDVSNLTELRYLNCTETGIKYVNNLINLLYLDCSETLICDVYNLVNLLVLKCEETYIVNVNTLTKLRELNCYKTKIKDLSNLINLYILNCHGSRVTDVNHLINLTELGCSNTKIKHIDKLKKLNKIYCKNTLIEDFSNQNGWSHISIGCDKKYIIDRHQLNVRMFVVYT